MKGYFKDMKKTAIYRREIAELTGLLRRLGLEKAEIIRLLDLPADRFAVWEKTHRDLQSALAEPTPAMRAEEALVKRALGFQLSEATAEELVDKNTGELMEVLKRRTVTKDVPPDVRALLFYLKNCWPERWSENQEEKYSYDPPEDEKEL